MNQETGNEMKVRELVKDDLESLLSLYMHLHSSDIPLTPDTLAEGIWKSIQECKHSIYMGAFAGEKLVAACNAAVIPNFTRRARPYALIENVITHPDHRRCGYGRAVVEKVIEFCRKCNCYKIMLMSDTKRIGAHAFYRSLGFNDSAKRAFVLIC
jgi:GNAT superfamily N-acetyltransferase